MIYVFELHFYSSEIIEIPPKIFWIRYGRNKIGDENLFLLFCILQMGQVIAEFFFIILLECITYNLLIK